MKKRGFWVACFKAAVRTNTHTHVFTSNCLLSVRPYRLLEIRSAWLSPSSTPWTEHRGHDESTSGLSFPVSSHFKTKIKIIIGNPIQATKKGKEGNFIWLGHEILGRECNLDRRLCDHEANHRHSVPLSLQWHVLCSPWCLLGSSESALVSLSQVVKDVILCIFKAFFFFGCIWLLSFSIFLITLHPLWSWPFYLDITYSLVSHGILKLNQSNIKWKHTLGHKVTCSVYAVTWSTYTCLYSLP